MLLLALIGLLAAPATEALPRVPGMRFRLGMAESQMLQLGSFPEARAPEAGTLTTRRGPSRFFGVPGEVICYINNDRRLERVRFEAGGVSRHSQDYVDGQLRRMNLKRTCERDERGERVCDWVGPGYRVGTRLRKDSLVVRIEPWPPPVEIGADSSPGRIATAGLGTRPPGTGSARSTAPTGTPPAPRPPPVTRVATPPAASPTRTSAPAATIAPVAMLPETLTISLTTLNSPEVWPRIVSSPPLDYPADARRESIQGIVWVLALVETDGSVNDAWIERSIPELDTAALAWVSRSRLAPCERQGRACRFHVRVAVRFTLY